jgi:hypothetical protein
VLIEKILKNSNAVRTLVHPSVQSCISNITPDLDSVIDYKTNIVNWLKPIIDLSEFYVYPTNGITEGLNWWLANETRSIHIAQGDYQWVHATKGKGDILYMSSPSSINGNWKDIPNHMPVALDLAYVGSTAIRKLDIPKNVEYVFYSLSKPFGVRNVRTGWLFTRKPQAKLEALIYNAKYYNYYAWQVAEKIINNYDIDFVYNTYQKQQKNVCDKLNITASDSVWIATSENPIYSKFRRDDKVARLCLAGVYNEEA